MFPQEPGPHCLLFHKQVEEKCVEKTAPRCSLPDLSQHAEVHTTAEFWALPEPRNTAAVRPGFGEGESPGGTCPQGPVEPQVSTGRWCVWLRTPGSPGLGRRLPQAGAPARLPLVPGDQSPTSVGWGGGPLGAWGNQKPTACQQQGPGWV